MGYKGLNGILWHEELIRWRECKTQSKNHVLHRYESWRMTEADKQENNISRGECIKKVMQSIKNGPNK